MMRVFADTSGLFAALVRNDVNHPAASQYLARLLTDGHEIHTSSYVLLETIALLQARVGLDAARRFEEDLRPLMTVTWMNEPQHERAFRHLMGRDRRALSLVDCASFVIMRDRSIEMAFTFDAHFESEGFERFGSGEG
jgi:uncharacterized protein